MSNKSSARTSHEAMVEKFKSGLRDWERPLSGLGSKGKVSDSPKKTKTVRARGTAPIKQRVTSTQSEAVPPESDDRLVDQFKQGLRRWERPFEGLAKTTKNDSRAK